MSETLSVAPLGPGLICPACQVALVMSERQNIEIDYCPNCRGVWLDRGELDKIIDRSNSTRFDQSLAPATSPMKNSYPVDQGHRGSRHHEDGHRRKSWLREIFD